MLANKAGEEKDKEYEPPRLYTHYEQQVIRKVQHFYITGPIDDPSNYIDMIHKIQTATPDDIIYIHLNTSGGQLMTGAQIINAMQSTHAHVIASIEAEAFSLGTLIFLAADEFVVHDNCLMMIHNFSGAVWGKGHEQAAQLDATMKWFNNFARKLYIPFLSEDEFDRILKGEDIYLQSEDIRKRLSKMVKHIRKEQKEGLKEAKQITRKKTKETKVIDPPCPTS